MTDDPIEPMRVSDYREHDQRDHEASQDQPRQPEPRQPEAREDYDPSVNVRAAKRHTNRGESYDADAVYAVDPREVENLELLGFAYRLSTGGA